MKPILKYPYFLSTKTLALEPDSEEFYYKAIDEAEEESNIYAAEMVGPNSPDYDELAEDKLEDLIEMVEQFIEHHS